METSRLFLLLFCGLLFFLFVPQCVFGQVPSQELILSFPQQEWSEPPLLQLEFRSQTPFHGEITFTTQHCNVVLRQPTEIVEGEANPPLIRRYPVHIDNKLTGTGWIVAQFTPINPRGENLACRSKKIEFQVGRYEVLLSSKQLFSDWYLDNGFCLFFTHAMVYKTLPGEELLVLFESLKNTGLNQQELALAASLKMQPVTPNQLKELHFRSVLHLLHINKLLEAKQLLADPSLSIDDSPDFENLKILLLLKENKLEEALTLARTLVSKYQQHSGGIARYLLNNCGVILLTQKNLSEARAAMAEITKLNSLYKPPFSQLINKK